MAHQQLTPAILSDPNALAHPAGEPPAGIVPDFAHPKSRGPILIIVGGIMVTLMMLALTNRAYTKARIVRKFSWDDVTVVLAALGGIVFYTCCCWEIERGPIGKHQYEIYLSDLLSHNYLIPSYIINIVSQPVLGVTKLTFFLFYLQVFRPLKWLRISVYIGASLSTAFYLAVFITETSLATPSPHESWDTHYVSSRLGQRRLAIPTASVGLVIDILLLILPSVAVSQLQMTTRRKLGLLLIFGTGLIAVAASAVSVYYRYANINTNDATWAVLPAQLLILVEINVGVMTACLPAFSRMLHYHFPPRQSSQLSRYKITALFTSVRSQKSQLEVGLTPRGTTTRNPTQPGSFGNAGCSSSMGPYVTLESTPEPTRRDDLELGPMSKVETAIARGRDTVVKEDGIFVKRT